ncbi:MAG: hypothetical protein JXN60_00475 [Lentisphaerae bacterium]|nr:hypothetical protein [Lentisphaerota bacterium]
MKTQKFPAASLFPPEITKQRKDLLNAFWSGADIGRPIFVPVPWANKPFDGTSQRTPVQKSCDYLRRCADSPVDFIIAVGMPVARHPPHGSVREPLAHTALALDSNGKALVGIRVDNMYWRQPLCH